MNLLFHIMVMLVLLSAVAAAQEQVWEIYESTGHEAMSFVPMRIIGDTLYGSIDTNVSAIPVTSIENITILQGSYSIAGATVGGLIGLGLGILHLQERNFVRGMLLLFGQDLEQNSSPELQLLLYTGGGAVIGGILGALIPRQDVVRFNGATATVRIARIQELLLESQ